VQQRAALAGVLIQRAHRKGFHVGVK
jgi:hypothetical protein